MSNLEHGQFLWSKRGSVTENSCSWNDQKKRASFKKLKPEILFTRSSVDAVNDHPFVKRHNDFVLTRRNISH